MSFGDFKAHLASVLILLCGSVPVLAQKAGAFTDTRDGKEYATVTYQVKHKRDSIATVTWMAQNLNFKMPDSQCFRNEEENCRNKGRLYNWFEAKEACPSGWHLPDDDDWYRLANLFGGLKKAGRHLKAGKKAWPDGKGTGKAGFRGLPTGNSDVNGFYQERAGFFWSVTVSATDPREAYDWSFVPWLTELRHWTGVKTIGNAVRCVKN